MPTISVVICTYNGEAYLPAQLDTILSQTLPATEIIVQDDGSTDGTQALVRRYAERYPQIRLVVNSAPKGFNYNFSSAFTLATGQYIAYCDQDDLWPPHRLQRLVEIIEERGADLVYSNSLLFVDDPAKPIGLKNKGAMSCDELNLLIKPHVLGHQCLFRREVLNVYNKAVAMEHNITADTLLSVAAAAGRGATYTDEALVHWRRHASASSIGSSKSYGAARGIITTFRTLGNQRKRAKAARYFRALTAFPFHEASTSRIVRALAANTLPQLLLACWLCAREHRRLIASVSTPRALIKAFFTPLYFIRDCTNFAIHERGSL